MPGLAFTHDDWGTVTVGIGNVPTYAVETWDAATEGYDGAQNAATVLAAIVAWANAGGRSWSGAVTFTGTWADGGGSGSLIPALASSAPMDWTMSADAERLLGISSDSDTMTPNIADPVPATVGGDSGVRTYLPKYPAGGGVTARAIGYASERWTSANRLPYVEHAMTEQQCHALHNAMALASWPRQVAVWDSNASAWRVLSCGTVTVSRQFDRYLAALEVVG